MVITSDEIKRFVAGYKEAILFTEIDPSVSIADLEDDPELEMNEGTLPSDVTIDDFSEETNLIIHNECENFIASNRELIEEATNRPGYSFEMAGYDYWLTRRGHGTGFWDRKELKEGGLGEKLSESCRHDDRYVCFGIDNKIHYIG